jgi:hypothetical protein
MQEAKPVGKNIPALYEEYKANFKGSSDSQIDILKFLEVHKRGIDYYNSFGLGDYKKAPRNMERRSSRSQNRDQNERSDDPNSESARKRHNST